MMVTSDEQEREIYDRRNAWIKKDGMIKKEWRRKRERGYYSDGEIIEELFRGRKAAAYLKESRS